MRTVSTRRALSKFSALVLFLAMPARADDKAQAEALFVAGREAMAAGKYADACPKFEASNKLDAATGTQLNLANCYEKAGQTASAWALYTSIAAAASDTRAAFARQHASALLPTLSKLTVRAPNTPNLRVTRDGTVVDGAMMGIAIPVDPGHHVVEAAISGRVVFHREVDVPAAGALATVVVTLPP
jgi:hypothetical protein